MKAIVNVKNENGFVYQSEFNTIAAAIDYAKHTIQQAFNTPLFSEFKRKEVYVNVKSTGACKFFKIAHK